MELKRTGLAVVMLWAAWIGSLGAAGWNPHEREQMLDAAEEAIATFKQADAGLETYFKQAYGYSVFPIIGKGGFWFGGAFGRGLV